MRLADKSSVPVDLAGRHPSPVGLNYPKTIPRQMGKDTGKETLVFPIPQAVKTGGGSRLTTPHMWGVAPNSREVKPDEFSPIRTLYPQFFGSYPQFCTDAIFFVQPEAPYMWGVTSRQMSHPKERPLIYKRNFLKVKKHLEPPPRFEVYTRTVEI